MTTAATGHRRAPSRHSTSRAKAWRDSRRPLPIVTGGGLQTPHGDSTIPDGSPPAPTATFSTALGASLSLTTTDELIVVTNFPSEGCILLLAWSFFVLGVDVRGAHAAAAAGLARVLTSDAIVTANALNALLRLCSSLTGTVLSFLAFAQAALRLFF